MRVRGYADGQPCWAELNTSEPGAAVDFYTGLLGWGYEPSDGTFRIDGLPVAGLAAAPGPAGWLTYLAGARVDPLADLAVDAGGALLRSPGATLGNGRAAVVSDPAGAAFGVWQCGSLIGAQLGSQPGTICFTELTTPDPIGASAFYGKLFGWVAQRGASATGREYHDWLLGDRVVGGMVTGTGRAARWRTTFEVADLAWVRQRCLDGYGRVAVEPVSLPEGRYARLVDPTGADFGVIELSPELRGLAG